VPTSFRKQLGKFLRQKRGERTLRDFGKVAGLSSSTLQRLEIGEQNVTLDTLEKVLKRMGVSVRDVFRD
jgi:transcriptional regulator with XRE-family HTH domain